MDHIKVVNRRGKESLSTAQFLWSIIILSLPLDALFLSGSLSSDNLTTRIITPESAPIIALILSSVFLGFQQRLAAWRRSKKLSTKKLLLIIAVILVITVLAKITLLSSLDIRLLATLGIAFVMLAAREGGMIVKIIREQSKLDLETRISHEIVALTVLGGLAARIASLLAVVSFILSNNLTLYVLELGFALFLLAASRPVASNFKPSQPLALDETIQAAHADPHALHSGQHGSVPQQG